MAQGPAISGGGGGGQSSGDVRAGGAFVEVSAKDRLSATLLSLKAKAIAFTASLNAIGKVSVIGGLAGLSAAAGFLNAGLDRAEEASKLADELGFSVEQMQRLKFAADVAGVSLEEVLSKPDKFKDLMNSAPILNGQVVRDAVEANRAFRASWIELQTALTPLISTLVPLVRAFAAFVRTNADLARVAVVGAAGLTAVGAAALGVSKAMAVVGMIAAPAVAVVGALFTKVGLAVGALGGLVALILTSTESGRQLAGDLGTAFTNVGVTFSAMFKAILDAIKAGDFERAWKAFTVGVEAVWYEMLLNMARAFSKFIEQNRDRLLALGALMGGLGGGVAGARFGPIGAAVGAAAGGVGGGIAVDQLAKLIEGIALNTGLEERRAAAQAELKRLANMPDGGNIQNQDLAARIVATRGAFRTLFNANQQFGGSGNMDSLQLEQMKQAVQVGKLQVDELKRLNAAIQQMMKFR